MSARVQVDKYFAALERLKVRKKPINNDAVALEAGCGRGSIKKSRPAYAELITAIEAAAKDQAEGEVASDPVPALRQAIGEITRRLDQSLDRELALLHELYDLRAQVKQFEECCRRPKTDSLKGLVPIQN